MVARPLSMAYSKKANIIPITIIFFLALCVLSVILAPMLFFIGIGASAVNGTTNGDLMIVEFYFIPFFLLTMFIVAYAKALSGG